MRSPRTSLRRKIGGWKLVTTGVRNHLDEIPHLAPTLAAFERKIAEAEALAARQEALRAELQQLYQKLDDVAREGEDLRARMTAGLRMHHGFASPRLVEYGVKPRKNFGRPRKSSRPAASEE